VREIESTRRRYWQLVGQLQAHRGEGVLTSLCQVVDTDGNVWANNGDQNALFGCGEWVGRIKPRDEGFTAWGLEAAGAPFIPPPNKSEFTQNARRRRR
jgi:hypothetical protein